MSTQVKKYNGVVEGKVYSHPMCDLTNAIYVGVGVIAFLFARRFDVSIPVSLLIAFVAGIGFYMLSTSPPEPKKPRVSFAPLPPKHTPVAPDSEVVYGDYNSIISTSETAI